MNNDTHVDELIPWYALGVLSPSERAQIETHLATCSRCRALAADAESTVQMIPDSVEPVMPSPAVKQNLMARVDADLTAERARISEPAPRIQRREWFAFLRRAWMPALTVASVALVIAMLVWNRSLQDDLERTRTEFAPFINPSSRVVVLPAAVAAPTNAQAKLYILPDNSAALLTINGLKRLGNDQTYEFWLIRGGKPVPAGLFSVDLGGSGYLFVRYVEPVGNFDQAGITIERAGGADSPTMSALVFAGAIQ